MVLAISVAFKVPMIHASTTCCVLLGYSLAAVRASGSLKPISSKVVTAAGVTGGCGAEVRTAGEFTASSWFADEHEGVTAAVVPAIFVASVVEVAFVAVFTTVT